jgi:hypothetical protein
MNQTSIFVPKKKETNGSSKARASGFKETTEKHETMTRRAYTPGRCMAVLDVNRNVIRRRASVVETSTRRSMDSF